MAFRPRTVSMSSLQGYIDNMAPPDDDGYVDSVASDLLEDLLTPKGSREVDDESVQLRIDIEAMRAAYATWKKGGFDAALIAFKNIFEDACRKAAQDEAPDVAKRRIKDAQEAAAADRAEERAASREYW